MFPSAGALLVRAAVLAAEVKVFDPSPYRGTVPGAHRGFWQNGGRRG
jgi:hypothetical protein